jgi:putative membrane protein
MKFLLTRWLILSAAFVLVIAIVPGIDIDWTVGAVVITAAIYGIVNAFLGRILKLLSLPLMLVTFGLFAIVINVVLLYVAAWLSPLEIDGFLDALIASLILSLVTTVMEHSARRREKART